MDGIDAYVPKFDPNPNWDQLGESVSDERLDSPSDSSYEAALRGAANQIHSAPYFKREKQNGENGWRNEYERQMNLAFATDTSIFSHSGKVSSAVDPNTATQSTFVGDETVKDRVRHDFVQQQK